MTNDIQKKQLKIVLIGDVGTGKTNLISRYTTNEFNTKYEPTNGSHWYIHDVVVENQTIEMEIWDIGGHPRCRSMANFLLKDADGILLVYDISNADTFENVDHWLKDVTQLSDPKTIIKLVGNKNDLKDQRAVPMEKAHQFAADHGLSFIETSTLNHNNVKNMFQDIVTSLCDDAIDQEPFHIVLVEIESTRFGVLKCVEKSLNDDNLKFMALSYRWGEVQEQCVDTGVGYNASITSFYLKDLYDLCFLIKHEIDLQYMEYVWVDAICVDQKNQARRKATIYQMSNIYQSASYILAVPDLHLSYLQRANVGNRDAINNINKYSRYIAYLLHGKVDKLVYPEQQWIHEDHYKAAKKIDLSSSITNIHKFQAKISDKFEATNYKILKWANNKDGWKRLTSNQAEDIEKALIYLSDLIVDWSSRVWVISEFHIAKNKESRKLKFWFMALDTYFGFWTTNRFFEFDFNSIMPIDNSVEVLFEKATFYDPLIQDVVAAYKSFKLAMIRQLNQQSFLEMMLKSKASRNEDRFYAVFPTSDYKDKLTNKELVSSWKISDIISVKLKLLEIMNIKDKLDLLHLTYHYSSAKNDMLPTFATVNIDWPNQAPQSVENDGPNGIPYNFDLDNNDTLQLIQPAINDDNGNNVPHYRLKLKPIRCFVYKFNDNIDYGDPYFNMHLRLPSIYDSDSDLPYEAKRATIEFKLFVLKQCNKWDNLGINYKHYDNEFELIRIPMYAHDDDNNLSGPMPQFYLVGIHKTNQYIIINKISNFDTIISILTSLGNGTKCEKDTEFFIY